MTVTVTIGGVLMTGSSHFVQEDSMQHVNALGQRDTFQCVIVSPDGSYTPAMGAAVVVADDDGNRFGGSIRNVSIDQFGVGVLTTIQCASWEQIFDRRLVGTVSYSQQAAGDIFQALLTAYTGAEGITSSIVITGPTLDSVSFDFCSVREAFDTLCDLASNDTDTYMWDCTADKVARFYRQSSFPAPFDVTDSSTEVIRPITLSRTFDGYANKVFVRVGKFITDARLNTFHPDGTERTFTFELPIAKEPTIVLDGVTQTVGVKDVDTGKQWYWQDGSPDVTQDDSETIPSSSSVLDVTAQGYQSTVIDAGENTAEVTARGTAEDNSGWYMTLLEASDAHTSADAQATGQAWLDTHSEVPWTAEYITPTRGFRAGQYQTIHLTGFGETVDSTFVVESVTLYQTGGYYGFKIRAVDGALANNWLTKLRKIATGQGGSTGTGLSVSTGGGSGSAPPDVLSVSATGTIDPITGQIALDVTVSSGGSGTSGVHLYLEIPDQSAGAASVVGSAAVGTTAAGGSWSPVDLGKHPLTSEAISVSLMAPAGVDASVDTPCRIYAAAYNADFDKAVVRATLSGATPNEAFTLVSQTSGDSAGGTNVTTLTGGNGATIRITAAALSPVNVTGKLETPVLVLLTDAPANTPGWVAQLVLTLGTADPTDPANQQVIPGYITQSGPVYAPAADGITVPHSFALDTPKDLTAATIWLQAGLMDGDGNYQWNNIVPGITPSWPISYGSTSGTTDASTVMASSIAATMAVVAGLFGVAALGITNPYMGSGAVATLNIQALAVTNPTLGALAVDSAKLANSAATSTKIANLAVGTAAMQLLAADTTIIANAAVSNAKIQSLAVTGAQIANATIANANLGSAIVAQANIANLAVGTAQLQNLAVTDAKINDLSVTKLTGGTITATVTLTSPTLIITSGTVTVNIDGTNFLMVTNTSTSRRGLLTYAVSRIEDSTNTLRFAQVMGFQFQAQNTQNGGSTYEDCILSPYKLEIDGLPSSNPGSGTKQVWYDPSDSNRLKFAA